MQYDHIFDELDVSTVPFAVCELRGAADLSLGKDAYATFHYVLAGSGEVVFQGRPSVPLSKGTLILVPALQGHVLRNFGTVSDPLPQCQGSGLNLKRLIAESESNPDGRLVVLCSHVQIGLRGAADVIDLLREPLVEAIPPESHMGSVLGAIVDEVSQPTLGGRAMIRSLMTQCVIYCLRNRLTAKDSALAWMAALVDPSIWSALRKMLDAPGDLHSVESLAECAAMSRSVFAKKFTDAYGAGPMELLRDIRIRHAATLLCSTDLPVKRVAELSGYASRSAFSRTFEVHTGLAPRDFRAAKKDR